MRNNGGARKLTSQTTISTANQYSAIHNECIRERGYMTYIELILTTLDIFPVFSSSAALAILGRRGVEYTELCRTTSLEVTTSVIEAVTMKTKSFTQLSCIYQYIVSQSNHGKWQR